MFIFPKNKNTYSKIKLLKSINFIEGSTNYTGIPNIYPPFFVWDPITPADFKRRLPEIFSRKFYSIYIHFPFCKRKCSFCKQFSFVPQDKELYQKYEEAVIKEVTLYSEYLKNAEVICLVLGGGTPTLFNLDKIVGAVRKHFLVSKKLIINIETTLNYLREDTITYLKEIGTTRLVIGIQSFDRKVLSRINRDVQEVRFFKNMVRFCKKIGIRYVNVELIAGLPLQNLRSLFSDIKNVIDSDVDSLHVYPLLTTPNTDIWKDSPTRYDGFMNRRSLKMLRRGIKLIRKSGFRESCYDLCRDTGSSNPVFLITQNVKDYGGMIGVGLGSFSRCNYAHSGGIGVFQYINTVNLAEYFSGVNSADFPVQKSYSLCDEEILRLYLIRALGDGKLDYPRLHNELKNIFDIGINMEDLRNIFGKEFKALEKIGKVNYGKESINFTGIPYPIYSKVFYSRKILLKCIKSAKALENN